MAGIKLDFDELSTSLAAIVQPDTTFEIRLLAKHKKRVDAGYFNSIEACATALSGLEEPYKGIYITPNPVNPDLISRASNRIKPWAEWTTHDSEVIRRTWLLIDIDPVRPAGISSTELEHSRAIFKARQIAGMLELQYGWCGPMLCSSGNGAHLLYPINEPNDDATRDTIKQFLRCLANRFNTDGEKVDPGMFNASRIWRLYGTAARKGDNTPQRPHRKARILDQGDRDGLVCIEQVQEFIDQNPLPVEQKPSKSSTPVNEGEAIYRRLNQIAMNRLEDWVHVYFPGARSYQSGYRVASAELGRNLEEDLSIQPYPVGILDFGEHDSDGETRGGKRTPVSVVAEFHCENDIGRAATALSELLNVPKTEFDAIADENVAYREVFEGAAFNLQDIRSFSSLKAKSFKELTWVIPDVLPVGCFILAARPKMRKTWLALQLCVAVATGSKFLEWQVNKSEALFLGLEDNERRLKKRIETFFTFDFEPPSLENLYYFTEGTFPRGEDGCEVLGKWLDEHPNCRLIVIDTFAHFRKLSNERDVYLKDYLAAMPITRLAASRQVCIILVHHEKKGLAGMPSGDFLEDVNGSSGLTGGTDGVISIKGKRGVQEEAEARKLLIAGRDVPHDYGVDMAFDAERGGWLLAARQDTKTLIRELFRSNPFMTQSEVIALLPNLPPSQIRQCLIDMKFKGELTQNRNGYSVRS